ncbi:translocase of chloroplast 101, chloroplastic-like [Apium graveolens]|uniref:translocase of chloroplast 101, chloroplastic-like n=1 Tax=Apium graveolens TaxID=4045 RepID=UPI003D78C85B
MESEEIAAKSSLSCEKAPGSFSVENSDTNAVKDLNFLNVNDSSGSSSNGSGFFSFSSDDNGVVSSEEGFETASEKPILESTDIETVDGDSYETFVGFSMSRKDEFVEFGDDVVGEIDKGGVLEGGLVGEKLVGGFEAFLGEGSGETFVGVSQFLKVIKDVVREDREDSEDDVEKLGDSCEAFCGEDLSLNLNGSADGVGQDDNVIEYKGDSVCVLSEDFSLVPKEGFVGKETEIVLKGDNVMEDDMIRALNGKDSDRDIVEKYGIEQISADIVQGIEGSFEVACKGDSVVEAMKVDLLCAGMEEAGSVKSDFELYIVEVTKTDDKIRQLNEGNLEQSNPADNVNVDMLEPGVAIVCNVVVNEEADGCVGNIQDYGRKKVTQAQGGEIGTEAILENHIDKEVVLTCNSISDNANEFLDSVDQTETVANSPFKVEEDKETDDAFIQPKETYDDNLSVRDEIVGNSMLEKLLTHESSELNLTERKPTEEENGMKVVMNAVSHIKGLGLERGTNGMTFGRSMTESDGVDSDEEEEEEKKEGKVLFDSSVKTDLLKAAVGVDSGGSMTLTSQDLFRLIFSQQSFQPAARPNSFNIFRPSSLSGVEESVNNLSQEEKRKLEKLQSITVKYLRLVKRLGLSADEPLVARVLYRLGLIGGRQSCPLFGLDTAKRTALQLEEDAKEDIDFSLNILVLGKSGVGKSATINSIFGEEKVRIDAFQPATSSVKEITGVVHGVKIRVFDTPGLKSSAAEQSFNCSVLSSVKKITKKTPLDSVLYVDRLDAQTGDLDDLHLLQTIDTSLGSSFLQTAIVTLTHAASAPPEGPYGFPLSYDAFISQRSKVLLKSIRKAVPNSMNQVCLVENHFSCRKNREGQKVLPNGQIWKQQLMMLCYSTKILIEANSISEPQESFNYRSLLDRYFRRSLPSLSLLSSTLQSHVHQKILSFGHGHYNCDADIDLEELSDSDKDEYEEDDYEYDQLPPFKPLKKTRLSMLSKEQRKAYFEEYDYRVKLLQKKQWKEELKRMKAAKIEGMDSTDDYGNTDEDPTDDGSFPLPPPSPDGDEQAYQDRFVEPTSHFLARPTQDTIGWDHGRGYDGVNLLKRIATSSKFPAEIEVQISADKKEFTINLVSSIATKHGEKGSSLAGFDIKNIEGQTAYIIRGETKLKNFKKNKTTAGITITHINEKFVTGLKLEDQITLGRQYSLAANAGMIQSQEDVVYGANFNIQRREHDYPIGQIQSLLCLSMVCLRNELCYVLNSFAQFSIGWNSKVDLRANINQNRRGQICVRTSSSESPFMLASILYAAVAICRKLFCGTDK